MSKEPIPLLLFPHKNCPHKNCPHSPERSDPLIFVPTNKFTTMSKHCNHRRKLARQTVVTKGNLGWRTTGTSVGIKDQEDISVMVMQRKKSLLNRMSMSLRL